MTIRYCYKFYRAKDKFTPSVNDPLVDGAVLTPFQAGEWCRELQANSDGFIYYIRGAIYRG